MKKLFFLLLVIFPSILFSQKEAAIWYFGQYAGLDFNSGVPVVLTDGQLDTYEGCATISDYQGNLLFYTDGVSVWDSTHTIMFNGTGLLGNASSSQSAIIVPKPNNPDQYYIFTVDDRNAASALSTNGINFTTVDMTLNGGLGDVITAEKNLSLISPAYEKITAVKHPDNNSFWVISFIQNTFYSWRVDATGVNTTPITSIVSNATDSRGYLKISPDGTKIACANFGGTNTLMLYDFDNTTGLVTNELQLTFDDSGDIPYGVEFSEQSRKLYVTTSRLAGSNHVPPARLYQFDLLNTTINASRVLIDSNDTNTRGGLQLAIDGKIYRALSVTSSAQQGTNFLGVINDPEADGLASNYVHNAIDVTLGGAFPSHQVVEGLPPFIQSFFLTNISADDVCLGDATQFSINTSSPPTSIVWDFGDPASGTNNTSTLENPTHIFSSAGTFDVTATITNGATVNTSNIQVTIFNIPLVTSPVNLVQCDDDTDGFADFNLEQANTSISSENPAPTITYFETEANAIANTNPIVNPTAFSNSISLTVWARVENSAGCFTTAEVNLQVVSTNIPSDLMITFNECDDTVDGDSTNGITLFDFSAATNQVLNALLPETNLAVTYYENMTDALAEINDINPANYRNITSFNQQIVVRVDNTLNDCFGLGYHVTLNVTSAPIFDLDSSTDLCLTANSPTISVENPAEIYTYEWKNDLNEVVGTTQSIQVFNSGLFTVTAFSGTNCATSKSIQVNAIAATELTEFNNTNLIVQNNSITVDTSNLPLGNYEYALDEGTFQASNIFENVSGGEHTISIQDLENCSEGKAVVSIIAIPNFFTPNGDGFNDTWQVTGISDQPNSNIYIFDRFGKLIAILDPLGPGWDGLYKSNPLPSTDYWYKVELEDGRILKGHFSLIRN
ncbi:T9SS type B sorting domain-containing protein [Lutibacter sp.]|uniref:T9SS type B sorting domain-containing protein n=1 Tax=Lutibacter sp. TaxID=1925666 RepID=UPI0035690505